MNQNNSVIPRPLVRVNQWSIVISVILLVITGNIIWLFIPLLSGMSSLLFDFHPLMALAKPFLKKDFSQYVLEDKIQQRFNQTLAVIMLSLSVLSHWLGWPILTYIFAAMVFTASGVAILGFCIGCFIRYQWILMKQNRKST